MSQNQVNTGDFRPKDVPLAALSNALMTLSEAIISTVSLCKAGFVSRVKAIHLEFERRRTSAKLHGLSDHVLKDIGVSRYEIRDFVNARVR